MNHPGRAITEPEMISIFAEAYGQAANVANAISGFKKTGIHPFDSSYTLYWNEVQHKRPGQRRSQLGKLCSAWGWLVVRCMQWQQRQRQTSHNSSDYNTAMIWHAFRGYTTATRTNSVYDVKFRQNWVRTATVREVTDRQTDRQTRVNL